MQQRVGVVRALANEPDVLLMDEPFASVDAQTRMTLQEELTRIWQEKKPTVIFITHDVAEAVFLANRVVALSKGRVLDEIAVDLPRPRVVGRAARGRALQGAYRRACCNSCVRRDPCGATRSSRRKAHVLLASWLVYLGMAGVAHASRRPGKIVGLSNRPAERVNILVDAAVLRRNGFTFSSSRPSDGCPERRQCRSKFGE